MILQHIEDSADKIIIGCKIKSWPVSPTACAEYLNVTVRKMALVDGIVGMFILKDEKPFIVYSQDEEEIKARFTVAHELGHYILHSTDIPLFVDRGRETVYQCYKKFTEPEIKEREANSFAAALLMPKTLIQQALVEASDKNVKNIIEYLANEFKVSVEAMSIRLSNLGILEYGIVAA